jgi:hypothetical protein
VLEREGRRFRISLWSGENALKLTMMLAEEHCEYTKIMESHT